jgi:hypothetical protein
MDLIFDVIPDQSITVNANSTNNRYILQPKIHAGILGSPVIGDLDTSLDSSLSLIGFDGFVKALHCDDAKPTMSLDHLHGGGHKNIDLSQTQFVDWNGSSITCTDLRIDSFVSVTGTLLSDKTIQADQVFVK